MDKKINQLKSGVILSYISMLLTLVSSLMLTPYMIKCLGQSEYGLYQLIGAFAGYLGLLEFGIGTTTVRYLSKYNQENDEISRENFITLSLIIYSIITLLIIVVSVFMFINIEDIFINSIQGSDIIKAKTMFVILVIGMIFATICSVFGAILTSFEEFFIPRLMNVASNVLKIIMTFVLLFINPTAVSLTILSVSLGIIFNIFNVVYSVKKYNVRIKLHYWDYALFKEVMTFSLYNFMNMLMAQIYWKLDTMIIGVVMSTSMVAIYSIGMQLNNIILNLTTSVTTVILPRITKLVTGNASRKEITMFMVKIGRIILILYSMILIGFLLFGKQFVILWAGEEYILSYYIALIIIVFAAIPRIQGAANDILKAKNKHGFLSVMYIITGLINILITLMFIEKYGLLGCASGTAFSLIVGNIVIANIYYEKKADIDVRLFFKETFRGIWKTCLVSLIICIPLSLIETMTYTTLFIKCGVFFIVYVYGLILWGLNEEEKIMFKDLLPRKRVVVSRGD